MAHIMSERAMANRMNRSPFQQQQQQHQQPQSQPMQVDQYPQQQQPQPHMQQQQRKTNRWSSTKTSTTTTKTSTMTANAPSQVMISEVDPTQEGCVPKSGVEGRKRFTTIFDWEPRSSCEVFPCFNSPDRYTPRITQRYRTLPRPGFGWLHKCCLLNNSSSD